MKWFLCFLLLLTGCQSPRARKQIPFDVKTFWKDQDARFKAFQSYSAKMNLRYRGKDDSVSGKGTVLVDHPAGMRLELHDSLGRLQYVLLSKKEFVTAYYPGERVAYLDAKRGTQYFERVVGLTLSVEELRLLWLGILPFREQKGSFQWDEGEGLYCLTLVYNGLEYQTLIEPENAAIVTLRVKGRASSYGVFYEGFESVNHLAVGHDVQLESKELKTKIEVEWDRISAFPKTAPKNLFDLEENEKVRRVTLK